MSEVFLHCPWPMLKARTDNDVLRRFATTKVDRCCSQMTKILEIYKVSALRVRYSLILKIKVR